MRDQPSEIDLPRLHRFEQHGRDDRCQDFLAVVGGRSTTGTSHMLSKDEAKFVFEKGCEQLIVGSGQIGNVRLSPEAESYFPRKDCKVLLQRIPEAIQVFNRSRAKKIGLFHVTC
jgi:hypothetical protein